MSMICELYEASPFDLERLHSDPAFFAELTRYGDPNTKSCSLEKAWHGLHYLLTGEPWGAPEPLGFIVAGGSEIDGSDTGYGEARSFTPAETQQINAALSTITDDQLWSRFNPEEMTAEGVYPTIWDEPGEDLKDEYTMYFRNAKQFIAEAAVQGHGFVVSLG